MTPEVPMSRVLLLLVLLAPALATAAEDLNVLPKDPPPRKALYSALLAECQKHFQARKAVVEKLKTASDVQAYQQALKTKFVDALGGFPEKTPLNARTVGSLKRDGYRIEKVIYESRPNHHVTANLYIPEGKGPFPGIVMPLGHSTNGKAAGYMQRGAVLLAQNGFVALVYDPIGQGERMQLLDKLGQPEVKGSTTEHTLIGVGALLVGRCTASYRIWDGIRSIDYLASRPEVDPAKIGCTGCSGGGTLTSYLMALDDRIVAAAPSCFITSLDRLFQTLGPQDAEQNIPGQVAFGMDHADYLLLRAPKPTLICAATGDFFDIQGTWDTFREVKRIYTRLGVPERVEMLEADTKHGYEKHHREGMARFFSRWLKGVEAVIVEKDFPLESDKALQCTRTGQVLSDLRGKSCYDLNAEAAADLAKARGAKEWKAGELAKEVERVLGLPAIAPAKMEDNLARRDGFPLPLLKSFKDATLPGSRVIVHDRGKEAALSGAARINVMTFAIDPRGIGETAPGLLAEGKRATFGVTSKEAFLSQHLAKPLLGQQVADLLACTKDLERDGPLELVGIGSAAPVILHAAALNPKVTAVTLERGIPSWDLVVRTPVNNDQLVNVVTGALKTYDLPDLMASLAPRPLTIKNPVDAAGEPLSAEAANEAFKVVKDAYAKKGAGDKFKLLIGAK